jgi:hypothetical protein
MTADHRPAVGKRFAVPFVPVVKPGNEAADAAQQLSDLIAHYQASGWRYVRLESIATLRNNGCIAGLMGNGTSIVMIQVAVLEKEE